MTTQDGAADGDLPKEGDLLAGKYLVDRVLGQGGMGVVVAAHHTTLRQKVAIKLLLPEAAKRGDASERFLREARAAVSIQSEHVARVTDVGTLESGAPYMVMELLQGSDLDDVLTKSGRLPIEQAIDYILQACEALAEAHSLGILHRDIKPANIFVTARADGSPLVKVLDFGLAKATKDGIDGSLTATNVVMGSPYYMSPEQVRSFKSCDARSDIWSIGVILFQLLTGVRPFDAETLGGLLMVIGSDPPPSMVALRPEIPPELEAAIAQCLVKDPKGRHQTIADLARALAPFGAEDSHISVERILRVLSDARPYARSSWADRASRATPAPHVQAPAAVSAVTNNLSPSLLSGPTPPLNTGSGGAPFIKSGSMSAVAVGDAPLAPPPARGGRGTLGTVLGLVLVGSVAGAAFFFLMGAKKEAQTTHAEALPAPTQTASAVTPAPTAAATAQSDAVAAPADTTALAAGPDAGPRPSASGKRGAPGAASATAPQASGAVALSAPSAAPPSEPPPATTGDPYVDAPEPPPPAAATGAPAATGSATAKPVKKGKLPPKKQ